MSNEVVQRRCRRSPTGIEDCQGFTGGTGATGDIVGDQAAGGLSLVEASGVYETEGGNFIQLTSVNWAPQALSQFTDLGNGELQYDGAEPAIFHIAASATFSSADPDNVFLTYAIDGTPLSSIIFNSESAGGAEIGGRVEVSINDLAFLSQGMILSLFGSTEGGSDFSLLSGQISVSRSG